MEPECTSKCRSRKHGAQILSAITRGVEFNVLSYMRGLCCNYTHVSDNVGRTALHMAASCGKKKIVEFLLKKSRVDCNVKDWESGWTALHRSLYYGQMNAAKVLLEHGASLQAMDFDGDTPLDLVMADRLPYVEYSLTSNCDVYVWGSNTNFNLGLDSQQNRPIPEIVEMFRREKVGLQQVVMTKYHTVFLRNDGRVYTCGHGHGGRLGQDSEQTCISPGQVKSLGSDECIQICAGSDHTVFLMSNGSVWTCGLNAQHQLGHNPPPERLPSPKPIKSLKGQSIVGIYAAHFHTVACTKDAVYTFGLNGGQLGHLKGDTTQITPKQVTALNLHDTRVVQIAVSDGATICTTDKGDIYALHQYQCRKIASKQLDILKVAAIGGHLDCRSAPSILKEKEGLELQIAVLSKSGKIFLWQESSGQLTRCLLSLVHQLTVVDLALNRSSIVCVTKQGKSFSGSFNFRKEAKTAVISTSYGRHSGGGSNLIPFLDKDECIMIKASILPGIHRAVSVTCDPKGRNFAVLQGHPGIGILESIDVMPSDINKDYSSFFNQTQVEDGVHDIIIKAGNEKFAAHRYILATRSEYFSKLLLARSLAENDGNMVEAWVTIDDVQPDMVFQILQYIYTDMCDFLEVGFKLPADVNASKPENAKPSKSIVMESKTDVDWKKHQSNPIKMLQEAARKMGVPSLAQRLSSVKHDGRIVRSSESKGQILKFDRKKHPHLYDVSIRSEDGMDILCHKCVLVCRLEYFHSMLSNGWMETSTTEALTIPVTSDVLEIVIDYLYSDEIPKILKCEDVEFLCKVLVVADQLIIERLKQKMEKALSELISLRSAAELLEFSCVYQANQLKAACMEFICVNIAALLESRSLLVLSDDALDALTKAYRNLIPAMAYRCITPYSNGPTEEEMKRAADKYPGTHEEEKESDRDASITLAKKQKAKRSKPRSRKTSSSEVAWRQESLCSDHFSDLELEEEILENKLLDISNRQKASNPISIPSTSTRRDRMYSESPVDLSCSVDDDTLQFQLSPGQTSCMEYDNGVRSTAGRIVGPILKVESGNGETKLKEIMFQQQRQEEETKAATYSMNKTTSTSSSGFKKSTKLSQKQRKKLAAEVTMSSSETEICSPISPAPAWDGNNKKASVNLNPWGKSAIEATVCSLKDIMEAEKLVSHSPVNSVQSKRKIACSPEVTIARSLENSNPWLKPGQDDKGAKIQSPSETTAVSFVDILRDEQKQMETLKPMQTKPLHLIQMEDEAIEQLLKYYNAADNPNERITVVRVCPQAVASPVWKAGNRDGGRNPLFK